MIGRYLLPVTCVTLPVVIPCKSSQDPVNHVPSTGKIGLIPGIWGVDNSRAIFNVLYGRSHSLWCNDGVSNLSFYITYFTHFKNQILF